MALPLRQSTARSLMIGPFLSSADGATPMMSLSIAKTDVFISKNGGTYSVKSEASTAAHDMSGDYIINFDTTDTNSAGIFKLYIIMPDSLPVIQEYVVYTQEEYDSKFVTNPIFSLLTTALTESYAAVGAPPTFSQAVMSIYQALLAIKINGNTVTIPKLNGDDAMVLNKTISSTSPDALTRVS